MKCSICGQETDFCCQQCNEPVCEDCCVPFTLQNQIDYALCNCCHDGNQARSSLDRSRIEAERAREESKKEARRIKRKENYRKPENVQKRREAASKRRLERERQRREAFARAVEVVNAMFRGMWEGK